MAETGPSSLIYKEPLQISKRKISISIEKIWALMKNRQFTEKEIKLLSNLR